MLIRESDVSAEVISSSSELTKTNTNNIYPFSDSETHLEEQTRIGYKGPAAFEKPSKTFLAVSPHCLFLSCTQPHIVYFLAQSKINFI